MAVYFIQNPDNHFIKIGMSYSVPERLKALSLVEGVKLELLGVIEGGIDKEKELHSLFDDIRLLGEWFADSLDLLTFIDDNAMCVYHLPEETPEDNTIIENAFSKYGVVWKPSPTIKEIAEKVEVSRPTVYSALHNSETAKIGTLRKIFKAMGYQLIVSLEKIKVSDEE